MPRGKLTDEIKERAKEFLGRNISQTELRLYPYIDNCLKNGNKLEIRRVNHEELDIMFQLARNGHMAYIELDSGDVGITVTIEFYVFIQEMLWMSYVEKKIEKGE